MESLKLTSVYTVINKIKRDFDFIEADDNKLIEWVGESLDALDTNAQYSEKVCYKMVSNYQTTMPQWSSALIQILRYNGSISQQGICSMVSSLTDSPINEEEETPINPCCEAVKDEAQNVYISIEDCLTTYAVTKGYTDLLNRISYGQSNIWTPIRLTTDKFFNDKVCKIPNIPSIYKSCRDEYTIIAGDILRFSFKTGLVAIAYLGYQLDENGYPLVPDDYSFLTAIEKYFLMKISERDFYAGKQGALQRFQKSEADWHFYVRQAKNKAMMISYDEAENLRQQQDYILPRNNIYDSHSGMINYKQTRLH